MKFTHYLLQKLVPEWIKFYLNFLYLKSHLGVSHYVQYLVRKAKRHLDKSQYRDLKIDLMENRDLVEKLKRDNRNFTNLFTDEIHKIITFTQWKYLEMNDYFQKFRRQIAIMIDLQSKIVEDTINITWNMKELIPSSRRLGDGQITNHSYKRRKKELLDSCFRFYTELQQLAEYTELNNQGIRKILKKYKKQELKVIRKLQDEKEHFGNVLKITKKLKKFDEKICHLKDDTEQQMIRGFFIDNPSTCRVLLRKYTSTQEIPNQALFYFGFFAGFAFVLILFIFAMRIDGLIDPKQSQVFSKVFPCFRGMGLFLCYYWFISIDVAGWNYFKINYKLYLGFNYHFSSLPEILQRVSILSTVYLITFVWYCIVVEGSMGYISQALSIIDPRYLPLIPWTIIPLYVFYPTKKRFNPKGRNWMYNMFRGALWGHFIKYESRFTFFTDQFASMVTPMRDLDYTVCYYHHLLSEGKEHDGECDFRHRFTAAQASILPYLLKCLQYLTRARDKGKFFGTDEMWNFCKTLTSMAVGILAYMTRLDQTYKFYWICVAIFCSCIEYWWDLKKDFLFFEVGTQNRFLRNDLGYNNPAIYYTLAILNFFLRLTWVLTISPDMYRFLGLANIELFIMLFGFIEMMRRLLNNFLKMEKEHITNLRNLKTVQEIRFPFKDESDFIELGALSESSDTLQEINPELSHIVERNQTMNSKPSFNSQIMMNKVKSKKVSFLDLQTPLIEEQTALKRLESFNMRDMVRNVSFEDFQQLKKAQSFRLTQIFENPNMKDKESDGNSIIDVDLQAIETAKQKEKLEKHKVQVLRDENQIFKNLLKMYEKKYMLQ